MAEAEPQTYNVHDPKAHLSRLNDRAHAAHFWWGDAGRLGTEARDIMDDRSTVLTRDPEIAAFGCEVIC